MNEEHAEALRRMTAAYENGETELDLSFLHMVTWPAGLDRALARLTRLQSLDLTRTGRASLLLRLGDLTGLQNLSLILNGLSSLPASLSNLTNLRTLHLSKNRLSSLPEWFGNLAHLEFLDIVENHLSSFPETFGNLKNLQCLILSGNHLSSLPESVSNFRKLQYLIIRNNRLSPLSDLLGSLTNLKTLDLAGNSLSSLPESFSSLTNLKNLNLSNNSLSSLPDWVSNLTNLQTLDLSANDLAEFPMSLLNLPSLIDLNLSKNPIDLLRVLPDLLAGNCLYAARAHFADLQNGAEEDRSLQCLVLGNGGVGKTCIVNRLLGQPFETEHKSTHAIRREELALPTEDGGAAIHLRVSDFGGQDIYHGTHRLFARAKAVFVIVWDAATENLPESDDGSGKKYANYPIAYWLDYVARQSPDSPVLIVQNKVERIPSIAFQSADYPNYLEKFRSIQACQVSAKEGQGFDSLRAYLFSAAQDALGSLESRRYGIGRVRIMRQLETWKREAATGRSIERRVLALDEFRRICREDGGISSPEHFLEFLHHTGAVFYDSSYMPDQVLVDQVWAIDGIYALFDRARTLEPLLKAGGRFTREQLERLVWMDSGYTAKEQMLFLEFMQACELCFVLDADGPEYLAPELAPEFKEADTDLRDLGSDANVIFIYEHEILHLNLARRFFVQVGRRYANRARYFRDAVEFRTTDNRNTARVRAVLESGTRRIQGRIEIVAQGPDRNSLVFAIRRHFEQMHDFGLPLPMRVSVDGGVHFASLDRVLESWKTGAPKVCATDADTLLDVADFEFLCHDEKQPIDITGRQLVGEDFKKILPAGSTYIIEQVIIAPNSNFAVDSPNAQVGDVSNVTLHLEDMQRVAQDPSFEEDERRLLLEVISTLAKAQAADGQQPRQQNNVDPASAASLKEKLRKLHARAKQVNDALAPYLKPIEIALSLFGAWP